VPLVPVGCGLETKDARARVERDALFEERVAESAVKSDRDERVAVLDVEIPGIPLARIVVVELENVLSRAISEPPSPRRGAGSGEGAELAF
jgi:hypothetical protein